MFSHATRMPVYSLIRTFLCFGGCFRGFEKRQKGGKDVRDFLQLRVGPCEI